MNTTVPLMLLMTTSVLCGCATEPIEAPLASEPPTLDTNVYFYPSAGRALSAEQQGRDKYECSAWAVQQTGFDPSEPNVPPHQRMQIVAGGPPSGAQVGAGAIAGAALGAAVSRPWEAGRGALLGGLAGAAIGGISAEHDEELARLQAQADLSQAQTTMLERRAAEFRRAVSACLEARGYSVR
ncbi:MAG TPA: hypothetical protein VJS42_02370 [Steroidobacteraceae bacterium]|nr:hypothetical protein [Steroidobacteraceae bacterium]